MTRTWENEIWKQQFVFVFSNLTRSQMIEMETYWSIQQALGTIMEQIFLILYVICVKAACLELLAFSLSLAHSAVAVCAHGELPWWLLLMPDLTANLLPFFSISWSCFLTSTCLMAKSFSWLLSLTGIRSSAFLSPLPRHWLFSLLINQSVIIGELSLHHIDTGESSISITAPVSRL